MEDSAVSHDAFEHEHEIEPGWTGGDIEFDDEPPIRERSSDSGERKWLLFGAAICGLVTAGVVLSLNVGAGSESPDNRLELPDTAFLEVAAAPDASAAPAPEPAADAQELRETTTLVAALGAAVDSPDRQIFDAPPAPPLLADEMEPEPESEPEPRQPTSTSTAQPKPAAPAQAKPAAPAQPKPAVVVEPVPAPSVVVKPSLDGLPSIEDEDEEDLLPSVWGPRSPATPVDPSEADADDPQPPSHAETSAWSLPGAS
ncbi:hypothetical protein [Enhygromyxa salina]|uniref:hypothetical protein n=1 Tax=Enhygromyxa salina TaxID=215803 RepID=UPI000698152A|nr:hypothetical protein [Enhygromyxa salina]